ncbi:MAG: hypothetical protein K2G32_04710, partial [Oscillospiraceae bacterium]|nr:hypothetical protein [Oscillospiraceae bacterium]
MTFKEKIFIIKRGIKMTGEMDKGRIARISAGKLLNTVQSLFHIYIVSRIIDMVVTAKPWRDIFIFTAVTAAIELAIFIALQTLDRRKDSHQFRYDASKRRMMWEKIINMDYVHIEDPDTHIQHHRAQQGIESMLRFIYNFLDSMAGLVSVIAGIVIIAPLALRTASDLDGFAGFISSAWGLLAVVAAVLLIEITRWFLASQKSYKYLADVNNNRTLLQYGRTAHHYLESVVRDYHNGKDVRIYNEQELIRGEYMRNVNGRLDGWRKSMKRLLEVNFVVGLLLMASLLIMYGFAAVRMVSGILTVGEMVSFVIYFSKIRQDITNVTNGFGNIFIDNKLVQYVYDLLYIPD